MSRRKKTTFESGKTMVNSLPAKTINREYKRLKLSIDKKRMKMKQAVYRGNQKIK